MPMVGHLRIASCFELLRLRKPVKRGECRPVRKPPCMETEEAFELEQRPSREIFLLGHEAPDGDVLTNDHQGPLAAPKSHYSDHQPSVKCGAAVAHAGRCA